MKTYSLKSNENILESLKKKNMRISSWAQDLIPKIEITHEKKYEIAIIKAKDIIPEGKSYVTTKEIRENAKEYGYETPPAEVGLLIRDYFKDEEIEEMGLWYIVAMHEPITSYGNPNLLNSDRRGGGRWLHAYCDRPDGDWHYYGGFAFAVPQGTKKLEPLPSSDPLNLVLRVAELEAWKEKVVEGLRGLLDKK